MVAVIQAHKVYRVGDRVGLRLGAHVVPGTVVEDFGFIGRDRQQIVRVDAVLDAPNVQQFELPAALLEPAPP